MNKVQNLHLSIAIFVFLLSLSWHVANAQQLTFEDVMKFSEITRPAISPDGKWVAYGVWPERGDGEAVVMATGYDREYQIERGERPFFNSETTHVALFVKPPFIESENAGKTKPEQSLAIIALSDGTRQDFENVEKAEFSNDGQWLIVTHTKPKEVNDAKPKNSKTGNPVKVLHLFSGSQTKLNFVHELSADSTSSHVAFSVVDTSGNENGLFYSSLDADSLQPRKIRGAQHSFFNNLTWDYKRERIAFTESQLDTANKYLPADAEIKIWQAEDNEMAILVSPDEAPEGYRLRSHNRLTWSHNGSKLYYGLMDQKMVELSEKQAEKDSLTSENLYDTERILNNVESMVWHWDDPLIKTHEKQQWNSIKNRLYMSVFHIGRKESVQLSDKDMPDIRITKNSKYLLGSSQLPYRKLMTWDGWYNDYYLVDSETGERELLLEKQGFNTTLSPGGKFVAWFDGKDWLLKNTSTGDEMNLTSGIDIPFYDEDNDRPQAAGSYGIAGWTEDDKAVLIYDKYDIWNFNTDDGDVLNVTGGTGRNENRIFRIYDLDQDEPFLKNNQRLLLTMYHDLKKNYGMYEARANRSGVTRLKEEEKRYNILQKAKESDQILYTEEKFNEFPNLYLAENETFRNTRKLTNLYEDSNERWDWGHAELVEWLNADGKKVQGVLMYPGDYNPDKRYPVLVYYYARFSQRLHEFNHPRTNHRPVFAQYTSDGYAVFLPDIWFDTGTPGYSATKNLVPGVQKLIEMGVADPGGIGLHGHSWSGYQTAFVVTQTDIFSAAVAGAPVSNMTSAYSGIRWGSGLARQFQYEKSQSRLGVSMWENLQPYIENSPVFFADRIHTPLLIQFGDEDGAVPWYQGIELYLAMRRLGKDSVFLHYEGEPHHLQKYPNKLDYAIKMKEYFDHYLKGEPPAKWITEGVLYMGK